METLTDIALKFKYTCNSEVYHGLQSLVQDFIGDEIDKTIKRHYLPIKTNWHPYKIDVGGTTNMDIVNIESA